MGPHLLVAAMLVLLAGCTNHSVQVPAMQKFDADGTKINEGNLEVATFAGGCFWCVESTYEHYDGIVKVTSGYTGGEEPNPTYEDVSSGRTGHVEAVQVTFDASRITYEDLLQIFWRQIDPTDDGGSFVDRGKQYRSAIFYHTERQREIAEKSKQALAASGKFDRPIATVILPAGEFYPAEDYHQDYFKKNPVRYSFYRHNSGRDQYRERQWGADKDYAPRNPAEMITNNGENTTMTELHADLKKRLTDLQYRVTQEGDTEPPFNNEYWNSTKDGIYVDIVSGEALFSSKDKFDSGTGWPSFTKPLEPGNIVETEENGWLGSRTEIKSRKGRSHLGHVFKDGPAPTGLRYCMNSAALRFIPKENLEKEGYGKYREMFG